eukprot:TRINITY_DN29734_c0_g1_i1.p3 TRINITY_DN29734_c0_g1~~TRINITY_DN29734_c0_g1_i1.p3  ORF type:complete len:338 (+),score=42.07 TRINITY_DN29734_c0_g1_i1:169-1182(+)
MSNQKQQDSNFLSDSFFDEPIHDEHNQDSPDFVSNAWNTKLSPVKWKLEFYDAELYLFCQMQQQKCEINDLVQAATVQAITVEFSQSKECLVLWVDEGICWQLGASTRIIKESNFEYNIFIPSDEQLLLLLHHGTPQRLINQFDQELSRICQLDDSGAQIRSEWELVTEVSTPHTEDLVAEIIGRSGRGLAKGIDYSSSALQKNIERVGLFSRHWTWKCSSEEERTTPAPRVVVESVENALWASEWGKDLVTGVADTVTGITAYVSNGVGNNLRATGWFTNDKNKPLSKRTSNVLVFFRGTGRGNVVRKKNERRRPQGWQWRAWRTRCGRASGGKIW